MSKVAWGSQLPGIPLAEPAGVSQMSEDTQRSVEAILRSSSAELLHAVREEMQELGGSLCQDVKKEIQHLLAECSTNGSQRVQFSWKDEVDTMQTSLRCASLGSPRVSVSSLNALQQPFVACDANDIKRPQHADFITNDVSLACMEDLSEDVITCAPGPQDQLTEEFGSESVVNESESAAQSWEVDKVAEQSALDLKSWAWSRGDCRDHAAQQPAVNMMLNGKRRNGNGIEDCVEMPRAPERSSDLSDASVDYDGKSDSGTDSKAVSVRFNVSSRVTTVFAETLTMGVEEVGACGAFIQRVVRHPYFDYLMGFILLCNAAWVGIQVDFMAREKREKNDAPTVFRIVDGVFCIIFVMELVLRILCYRRAFLRVKGWQWNLFDIIVVTFQLADEITKLAASGSDAQEAIDNMGVLRLLRLGRIVRLIRMVRLIPELKSMVYLISASMASFFWTMTLLMILIYCVAIFFTENAMDVALKLSNSESDSTVEKIDDYWGSIPRAAQSLYMAISGGDDWANFLEPLRTQSSVMNVFVFSLYIAFATLVMLNLVTGVFVEGAQRIIRKDKDDEMCRQVTKLFFDSDENNDMKISEKEFLRHLENSRMDDYFRALELNRNEARAVFTLLDTDHSRTLDIQEFVKGCLRLRGPARSVDLLAYIGEFKHFKTKQIILQTKVSKQLSQLTSMLRKISMQMHVGPGNHAGNLLRPPSIA